MAVDKQWSLDRAVELAQAHARGGSDNLNVDYIIQLTYDKLNELQADVEK